VPQSDEDAIRKVLALSCQLRDDDRYPEWIELFTPDATFDYGVGAFTGRDAILAHVTEHFPAYGKHLCVNSVIDVSGDAASAVSDFAKLHPTGAGDGSFCIAATGRYHDTFVRTGGRWSLTARKVVILR
jgi:hypothetical protein